MKPEHYRRMLDRAIASKNDELLDSICYVLAENEAAKAILVHKGYGTARMAIDAIVKEVPTNAPRVLRRLFEGS